MDLVLFAIELLAWMFIGSAFITGACLALMDWLMDGEVESSL